MNIYNVKRYILANKGKCIQTAAVVLVVSISLVICLISYLSKSGDIEIVNAAGFEITEETSENNEPKEDVIIIVDVQGAVNRPGIARLPEGSRVNDAVTEAGGLTEDADTMNVNLAARLSDGDKVYIPTEQAQKNEQKNNPAMAGIVTNSISGNSSGAAYDQGEAAGDGAVNINTANSAQLQTLNGVGPATAQKIIDYRENNGGFKKIEDIMKVSGIGTKTFQKLKDKIRV